MPRIRRLCVCLSLSALLPALAWSGGATCTLKGKPRRVDNSYRALAEATGGSVFRLGPGGKLPPAMEAGFFLDKKLERKDMYEEQTTTVPGFVMDGTRTKRSPVATTALPSTRAAARAARTDVLRFRRTFDGTPHLESIPVDSTIRKLAVMVDAECTVSLWLRCPELRVVDGTYPGTTIFSTKDSCAVCVACPPPGKWVLEVRGRGTVGLHVQARSVLQADEARYVHLVPGREGPMWANLHDAPAAGSRHRLRAILLGDDLCESVQGYELRNLEGTLVRKLTFENQSSWHYLIEEIEVPSALTRLSVTGTGPRGFPFVRLFSHSIESH